MYEGEGSPLFNNQYPLLTLLLGTNICTDNAAFHGIYTLVKETDSEEVK